MIVAGVIASVIFLWGNRSMSRVKEKAPIMTTIRHFMQGAHFNFVFYKHWYLTTSWAVFISSSISSMCSFMHADFYPLQAVRTIGALLIRSKKDISSMNLYFKLHF
jgi:hypothetical protein